MPLPYRDTALPVKTRVKDLVARMTLHQKIRQLGCIVMAEDTDEELLRDGVGGIVSFADFPSAAQSAAYYNTLQEKVIEQNEWGIPALFHAEGLCGALSAECAVFPAPIAMGASFDPELVEQVGARVRHQMKAIGVRQALAPVLDLARDFRWGRTNECFGSDPTLVSAMGSAYVRGLQSQDLKDGVAATAKHFLGHSLGEGGLNLARCQTDARDLRECLAKPYEAAMRTASLASVMTAYSEVDGKSISASPEILTELLREDMGFGGLAVSDYMAIDMLVHACRVAQNSTEAGVMALRAGLDMELPKPYGFSANLREAVKKGLVKTDIVDRALARVLALKFKLGLFENPFADPAQSNTSTDEALSRQAAENALVLLKNEGLLPLENHGLSVAVIGPTGHSIRVLNGTYTRPATAEMLMGMGNGDMASMHGLEAMVDAPMAAPQPREDGPKREQMVEQAVRGICPGAKSIAEALKDIFPATSYIKGCDINSTDRTGSSSAVMAAEKADVVVMTVGGKNGWSTGCTSGEGFDSTDIGLPGVQEELVLRVLKVNPNMVLVHTDGRPLVSPALYRSVPAVIEAWLPGPFGGEAIAKTIAGRCNPGGRLPVDVPRSVGQTPLYYYSHRPVRSPQRQGILPGGYVNEPATAQYPFGYGLSYTSFCYRGGGLEVETGAEDVPILHLSVEVENTGGRSGDEVVQLYGSDEVASMVRPQKELIGFIRVPLAPGQKKTVRFTFRLDQLAFPDDHGDWVLEKGDFHFFIGPHRQETVYSTGYTLPKTLGIDHRKRGFFARVQVD